jgi:glycosyltransferase involved in cell wall biosynthesis
MGVSPEKTVVIPNCVFPKDFGEPSEEPTLLTVGRLVPSKNQLNLVRALAHLNFSRFYIVGDGKARYIGRLKKEVRRLGLEERVILWGPTDDVWELFPKARVFVHSSSKPAPFSLAVLEAMAFGLPVVAWDCGDTEELLQNGFNGFRSRYPSEPFPARELELLLSSRERAVEMGSRGRELAEKFSPLRVRESLLKVYEMVAEKG